ncbi:MAG: hypothetical protein ACI81A_001281 [Paraglaciecola sp.]
MMVYLFASAFSIPISKYKLNSRVVKGNEA